MAIADAQQRRYTEYIILTGLVLAGAAYSLLLLKNTTLGAVLVLVAPLPPLIAAARYANPRVGLLALLALLTFTLETTFRASQVTEAMLDPQLIAKFTAYTVAAGYATTLLAKGTLSRLSALSCLYCLIAAVSTLWSPLPLITAGSAFVLGALLLTTLALSSTTRSHDQWRVIWGVALHALVAKALLSWAYLAVAPSRAFLADSRYAFFGGRFAGIAGSPNSLGANATFAAILALLFLLDARKSKARVSYWYALLFLFAVATLLLTQSRTALVAFVACVSFSLVFFSRRGLALWLVVILLTVGYSVLVERDVVTQVAARGADIESVTTMQGRTTIWTTSLRLISDQPWIGFGYGSARALLTSERIGLSSRTFSSAHNMFIESVFNVGLLGTTLLIWLLISTVGALVRRTRRASKAATLPLLASMTLLVGVIVTGVTESSAAGVQALETLLLFMCVAHAEAARRLPAHQPANAANSVASDSDGMHIQ